MRWIGPRLPPHSGQSRVGQRLGVAGMSEARAVGLRLPMGGTGSPPWPTAGWLCLRRHDLPLTSPSADPGASGPKHRPGAGCLRPRRLGGVQARARGSGDASPRGGVGAGAGGFREEMGEREEHSWQRADVLRPASPARGGGQRAACCPCPGGPVCGQRRVQSPSAQGQENPEPGHDISTRGAAPCARPCTALCVPDLTLAGQPTQVSLLVPRAQPARGREAGCLVLDPLEGLAVLWAVCRRGWLVVRLG